MNYSSKELKIVILEHTRECLKKKLKEQIDARRNLSYYLERTSKEYINEAHCDDNDSWFRTREYVTAKDYIKWKNFVFAWTKRTKKIKAEIKNMQRIINFLTN